MVDKPRQQVKRLFWDIETSPNVGYFWEAGYKCRTHYDNILQERAVICICYKWEGEKKTTGLSWNNGDDKAMLKQFMEVADMADEMVAHNGDKFDLKWFQTRCLFHGLEPPPERKTVDTLWIARRRFKFNSNRLDYIASFLGHDHKHEMHFDDWKAVIENKRDPKPLNKMVRYCKKDVILLEKVYQDLAPYHNPKTHAGVLRGDEKWTCARCGSGDVVKNNRRVTARGTIQHQMHCKECHGYYSISQKAFEDYCEDKRRK